MTSDVLVWWPISDMWITGLFAVFEYQIKALAHARTFSGFIRVLSYTLSLNFRQNHLCCNFFEVDFYFDWPMFSSLLERFLIWQIYGRCVRRLRNPHMRLFRTAGTNICILDHHGRGRWDWIYGPALAFWYTRLQNGVWGRCFVRGFLCSLSKVFPHTCCSCIWWGCHSCMWLSSLVWPSENIKCVLQDFSCVKWVSFKQEAQVGHNVENFAWG